MSEQWTHRAASAETLVDPSERPEDGMSLQSCPQLGRETEPLFYHVNSMGCGLPWEGGVTWVRSLPSVELSPEEGS